MKRNYMVAGVFATMLALSVALPASAQTKADLQRMYMDFLTGEGFPSTVDSDGDVQFKREGYNYYISVYEDDLEFFELFEMVNVNSEEDKLKAPAAANYANRRTKVAKVYLNDSRSTASISCQLFLRTPEDFKKVFSRILGCIDTAEEYFFSQFSERFQ
jgi:hypothetical protein